MAVQENINSKDFTTSDLPLATFLHATGHKLLFINRENPKRAIFIFEVNDLSVIDRWNRKDCMVNAWVFWTSFNKLKAKIYNGEES